MSYRPPVPTVFLSLSVVFVAWFAIASVFGAIANLRSSGIPQPSDDRPILDLDVEAPTVVAGNADNL